MDKIFSEIEKIVPKSKEHKDYMYAYDEFIRRDMFTKSFSWAIPTKEVINKITEFIGSDHCVETGCGSGLWAKLLQLNGVNIVPTDNMSETYEKYYTDIENISDDKAMEKYGDFPVLFLCWSRTYPNDKFRGNKIVYIGEDEYGCTNGFPDEKVWEEVERIDIPQWFGIRDFCALYVRR